MGNPAVFKMNGGCKPLHRLVRWDKGRNVYNSRITATLPQVILQSIGVRGTASLPCGDTSLFVKHACEIKRQLHSDACGARSTYSLVSRKRGHISNINDTVPVENALLWCLRNLIRLNHCCPIFKSLIRWIIFKIAASVLANDTLISLSLSLSLI